MSKGEEIMSELKNCPFCGSEVRIQPEGDYHAVYCETCGIELDRHTHDEAVTAWNTRPASPRFTDVEREAMDNLITMTYCSLDDNCEICRFENSECWNSKHTKMINSAIATVRAMLTASEIADKGKG